MTLISTALENKLVQFKSQWPGYVNMLKILESGFLSPKHWVLEFLQNAEDARASRLSIQMNDDSLWILNNGREFDQNDLQAICDVASQKRPSLDLHGYLGIGFKSIFRITNRVDIHSGELHFGFHREHWIEMIRQKGKSIWEWPWEILPIEIEPQALPDGYLTGFYADLTSTKSREVVSQISEFLNDDFPTEAILLLKHIKQIEVRTPQKSFTVSKTLAESQTHSTPDNKLCRSEIVTVDIKSNAAKGNDSTRYLTFLRSIEIDHAIREDEETERVRRSDISEREIGLVIGVDDKGALRPLSGKVAGVYSFLPVEGEQTGLPFGVFADFVPQPGRDLINYEAKWNNWMCDQVVEFFRYVTREIIATHPIWKFCIADLVQQRSFPAGAGSKFWAEKLREPINKFLRDEPLYPDDDGNLTKRDDLIDVEFDVLELVGKSTFKAFSGKKIAHDQIRKKVASSSIGMYELLHMASVLEGIKDSPTKLAKLYSQIGSDKINSYRIGGRQGRDTPLRDIPLALGYDNELHPPKELFVIDIDTQNIPKFLTAVLPDLAEKHRLHPEIAKVPEAVEGLSNCGLIVINRQELMLKLRQLIDQISKADDCPKTWEYPHDLIRSTLFLLANGGSLPHRLVSGDGTLMECKYLFLPRANLNWAPLYEANLLPMYKPIHDAYSNAEWLAEYGLNSAGINDQLKSAGIHGFQPKDDEFLTQNAAYAIARNRLNPYHDNKIGMVTQGKNLGYDLECQGHCSEVFEVKGMTEPNDIPLQPSEFREAKNRGENYHLICVYNLPSPPDKVGYIDIPNPGPICRPVERAVVPKKAWLGA